MRLPRAGSVITNDLSEVRCFLSRHGSVIYKSMSSVRSIVKELHASMLDSLGNVGPALFQQRIVGDNLRVHVIGESAFACLIRSRSVDYRYGPASLEPVHLPDEITARCVRLARQLGLVLAGIDLIVTSTGEYYCLEVNPNPAFSYFELSDDNEIAHAVAQALMVLPPLPKLRNLTSVALALAPSPRSRGKRPLNRILSA